MCREAKMLLVLSTLFTFAGGLSGIFVNVFFWRITSDFIVVAMYNLMHYLVTPITYILGGILAKRKNGVWSLRIGLLLYALFYSLILLLGPRGGIYIYILGALYGSAIGFYWLAFNTLCFDFTCVNNRDTFNGFNGSFGGIAAAVAPITAAFIISRFQGLRGYRIVFLITLGIFVMLVLLSMTLKCRNYGSKLNFKKVFSKNSKEWSIIRKATMFWTFRDVIITFLINILVMITTGSELSLGKITLMASITSSVSYVLVQKIIKPPLRKLSIYLGSIGGFLAVVGLMINIQYTTLLVYAIMDAFFIPFFTIQLSSSTFNVINTTHEEEMRVEYMINKDLAINGGRIISSIILIMLLMVSKGAGVMKIYLLFLGIVPLISGHFLRRLTRVLEGRVND